MNASAVQKPEDATALLKIVRDATPHIAVEVERRWGSAALNNYVSSLLLDTRENTRKGLPKQVASALLLLVKANREEHPALNKISTVDLDGHSSIWGVHNKVW